MVTGDEQFVVRIPRAMYDEMVAHVVAGYPNETCGLLASKDGRVVKNYPTANAAGHPDDFSEISPEDLLRIAYDIDEYDGEMYSYYHSHPKSEAYPSRGRSKWCDPHRFALLKTVNRECDCDRLCGTGRWSNSYSSRIYHPKLKL